MRRKTRAIVALLGVVGGLVSYSSSAQAASQTRTLVNRGTTSFADAAAAIDGGDAGKLELSPSAITEPATAAPTSYEGKKVDGSRVSSGAAANVTTSFRGLNLRQQRLANGGNQFTVEPPDQALCAGGGYVMEAVNDVLRVFDSAGNPLIGVVDLNTFYGYPAAIIRATRVFGPNLTDPVCYFDPDTQRFFLVVLTLDADPVTGGLLGSNHLDIAVSQTANPTGSWVRYSLAVQNDGTQGTPNHHCAGGPCIGDYPHIGADSNGIYVTTNEYAFFADGYNGAQVYALNKTDLTVGSTAVRLVHLENLKIAPYNGFTVWPAIAPVGGNDLSHGGTEYFLSSIGGDGSESGNTAPSASKIVTWALTNTSSLNTATPTLKLSSAFTGVEPYAMPNGSTQKDGPAPLRDCINDTTVVTPFGPGCWQYFFGAEPAHTATTSKIDSGDGRMQQVTYFQGRLYGALATKVRVEGRNGTHEQSASEWFVVRPTWDSGNLKPETVNNGYVAVGDNNVVYPSIGVTQSGKAIMSFTLVGADHYPSAGYVTLGSEGHNGPVQIIAEGAGPQDGFSGYDAFSGSGVARPRWGDYGATAVVGNTVWVANEYIAQTCTLAQYLTGAIGSCGGTRVALGNWATRISAITP